MTSDMCCTSGRRSRTTGSNSASRCSAQEGSSPYAAARVSGIPVGIAEPYQNCPERACALEHAHADDPSKAECGNRRSRQAASCKRVYLKTLDAEASALNDLGSWRYAAGSRLDLDCARAKRGRSRRDSDGGGWALDDPEPGLRQIPKPGRHRGRLR